MSKGIINRLKQTEEICMDSLQLSEYTELPFCLLNCKGNPFYAFGQIKGNAFKSPFFTLKSLDPKQHSAVLNILAPYPFQKGEYDYFCCVQTFLRTNLFVKVDLSDFSGISNVPIPISDSLSFSDLIQDNVRLPFIVRETHSPKMIWNTDENQIKNTATIILNYHNGIDLQTKMNICTKDKMVTLDVPKGKGRAITVRDLLYIEICPPIKLVQGIIEIQLNRKEERKIYLN